MANVAVWLMSIIGPLAQRVLVSLGVGWVTYEAFGLLANQVQSAVLSSWGQVGGVTMQILSLAGVPDALGIVLGGFTAKAALMGVARLGKVAG